VYHNAFVSHLCIVSHNAFELGNSTEIPLIRSYYSYSSVNVGGELQVMWISVFQSIQIHRDTLVKDCPRLTLKKVSIYFLFKKKLGHFGYEKMYSKVSNPPKSVESTPCSVGQLACCSMGMAESVRVVHCRSTLAS
jgi:hypothetical protein